MMRYGLTAAAILLLAGCASTSLPPVTSNNYRILPDEKRIWAISEREQGQLVDSGMILDDRKMTEYVNQVAMKVLPPDAKGKVAIDVVIINSPYSNAFAFANGKIYVHTGIIAHMANEAQLASLLAHEIVHVTHRHQVRERRSLSNKAAGMASFRATFGSLPLVGELSSALGEFGTMAAVSGYSKDLEREADDVGFGWMVAAGYDPREAPKLFDHMIAEMEEEAVEEPFFFGSHPKLRDRRDNFTAAIKKLDHPSGFLNTEKFIKATARAIFETARLDLKAGRFDRARKGFEKYLEIHPDSSSACYMLGEVYRQRNQDDDVKLAIPLFKKALKLSHQHADSARSLGLIYMSARNKSAARNAFKDYLRRDPRASDKDFILEYIRQL